MRYFVIPQGDAYRQMRHVASDIDDEVSFWCESDKVHVIEREGWVELDCENALEPHQIDIFWFQRKVLVEPLITDEMLFDLAEKVLRHPSFAEHDTDDRPFLLATQSFDLDHYVAVKRKGSAQVIMIASGTSEQHAKQKLYHKLDLRVGVLHGTHGG